MLTLGTQLTSKCSACGAPILPHKGYCKPCAADYARRYRQQHQEHRHHTSGSTRHEPPRLSFFGPHWLTPKSIPQIFATITASIVYGVCGSMADTPEY